MAGDELDSTEEGIETIAEEDEDLLDADDGDAGFFCSNSFWCAADLCSLVLRCSFFCKVIN